MRKTVHKLEKVMKPIYKRILLKLSGEGLMGDKNFGMSAEVIQRLAGQIKEVHDNGVQICLVIGGGNIFRGAKEAGVLIVFPAAPVSITLPSDHPFRALHAI